jgi:hypothetical protein
MKFTPKLPATVPESLKFKKEEPSVLVKARTHEAKAEKLRSQTEEHNRPKLGPPARVDPREGKKPKPAEPPRPHLEFLERWKVLEAALTPIAEKARKEYFAKLAEEPKDHQLLGHLIGSLPRPRLDVLMRDERLPLLNVALGHRPLQKIVSDNELLQDLGIDWRTFVDAKRDLKFQLGLNSYRSAQAIALYLTVIRAAVDPKVKKKANLVTDTEVLDLGKGLLREVTTHLIEELQAAHNSFFAVGDRAAVGEQYRIDRAKKSGRHVPDKDAPKGRMTTARPDLPRPSPGARKA